MLLERRLTKSPESNRVAWRARSVQLMKTRLANSKQWTEDMSDGVETPVSLAEEEGREKFNEVHHSAGSMKCPYQ